MRSTRKACAAGVILVMAVLIVSSPAVLQAISLSETAAQLGEGRGAKWNAQFAAKLSALGASERISPVAYEVALRAFSLRPAPEAADEAARLVFAVLLRADRELRRGMPPGEVLLEAKRWARLGASPSGAQLLRRSAGQQLRKQLSNMGTEISGDMGNRPGPQSGPGAAAGTPGTGAVGGSGQGGAHSSATGRPSGLPGR